MNTVAELKQIMSKETWTQEDYLRLREAIMNISEPVKKFRLAVAEMSAANPNPTGASTVKLGIANYMLCRFNEALELLSKGTDNKERRFYQALCYKHLRQWDRALEAFGLAEDRGWDPKEVTLETAEVQCLAGDTEAASRSIQRFAKSSQENADWHHVFGMVAEMQGDYDAAVESYETARRIQPRHPGATFRLAYYYDLHGDTEAATAFYLECVTRTEGAAESESALPYPIHANALLNLAVLYEDAGQYEQAEYCLRRILACNPNHPRAKLFIRDVAASKIMVFDEDEAKRIARRNDLLAIPVTDFELSVRARNCLKKMNIRTLGDLLNVTEPELLSYKNFGETSLAEIKSMLSMKNLTIGQMRESDTPEETDETETTGPTIGDEGVLATPLAQIELSVRVRKVLDRLKIKTLGELVGKTEPELLACQNFGKTSLDEINLRLKDYGLTLREIS